MISSTQFTLFHEHSQIKSDFLSQGIKLSVESALYKADRHKLDEEFKCSICFFVVVDAKSCEACENLFCKECIGCWQRNSKKCPICREMGEYRNINRLLKKQLRAIQFKCSAKCNPKQTFLYEDMLDHYRSSCPSSTSLSRCPLFCNMTLQVHKQDIDAHILICPNVTLQCSHCKELLKRSDQDKHICSYIVRQKRLRIQDSDLSLPQQRKLIRIVAKKLKEAKTIFAEVEVDLLSRVEKQFKGQWACFIGKDLAYITSQGKFCNFDYGKTKSIVLLKLK